MHSTVSRWCMSVVFFTYIERGFQCTREMRSLYGKYLNRTTTARVLSGCHSPWQKLDASSAEVADSIGLAMSAMSASPSHRNSRHWPPSVPATLLPYNSMTFSFSTLNVNNPHVHPRKLTAPRAAHTAREIVYSTCPRI